MTDTPAPALIVSGGWRGHQPLKFAEVIGGMLREAGLEVTASETLDVLNDADELRTYALIVPNWTMGRISGEQSKNLRAAVEAGTRLAGV